MFQKMMNKKGISEIVSYVLLVVLSIGLATATYLFLSGYIDPWGDKEFKCPEGVGVTVTDYNCSDNRINLTLKNSGRFNLAGIYINGVNKTDDREFLIYEYSAPRGVNVLNVTNSSDVPSLPYLGQLKEIVLYPYIIDEEGYNRLCEEAVTRVSVDNC